MGQELSSKLVYLRMNQTLYNYLKKEWRYNNHKKYQKYFDEWVMNVTNNQIYYYKLLWLKSIVR